MKPDKFDVGTTVKGLDYIDVPPNGKRDYKVNFYAHKEGITMCKVRIGSFDRLQGKVSLTLW